MKKHILEIQITTIWLLNIVDQTKHPKQLFYRSPHTLGMFLTWRLYFDSLHNGNAVPCRWWFIWMRELWLWTMQFCVYCCCLASEKIEFRKFLYIFCVFCVSLYLEWAEMSVFWGQPPLLLNGHEQCIYADYTECLLAEDWDIWETIFRVRERITVQ